MECADCTRLIANRARRLHLHQLATFKLNIAATTADQAHFMVLKTLADEAKFDLDAVDSEIVRHQDRHAFALANPRLTADDAILLGLA